MIRSYYSEIKFYKVKYRVYKIVTEEKTYYDLTKYEKNVLFWSNKKIKDESYYLRFDDFNKLINFIFN